MSLVVLNVVLKILCSVATYIRLGVTKIRRLRAVCARIRVVCCLGKRVVAGPETREFTTPHLLVYAVSQNFNAGATV